MGKKLEHATNLYMHGIRDGHPREAVEMYTGDRYTQHSTGVKDGKDGFVEFFTEFLKRCPDRDIQIIRGWEDGPYVFLHVYQNINQGEREWQTTDFFLTDENDKIIEHWDVISLYGPATPSGHTTLDGPTEVVDLEQTETNKQVVREMIETVLMLGGNPERVGEFIAEEYIQHNKEIPDGLSPFKALLLSSERPLFYEEIVLLVGKGNFVATLCKANFGPQAYAQVDVFRLEHGKIVEHWDNAEKVPEVSVNSGKF